MGLRAAMPDGVVVERRREPQPHFQIKSKGRSMRLLCEHSVAIRDGLSGIWYTPSETLRPKGLSMALASALQESDPSFAEDVVVWLPHGLAEPDFFDESILLGGIEAISGRLLGRLGI